MSEFLSKAWRSIEQQGIIEPKPVELTPNNLQQRFKFAHLLTNERITGTIEKSDVKFSERVLKLFLPMEHDIEIKAIGDKESEHPIKNSCMWRNGRKD